MKVLDARLLKKQPQPAGLVAKKIRKEGEPSKSAPPPNAPAWAIRGLYCIRSI